jgi:hypothetical protein
MRTFSIKHALLKFEGRQVELVRFLDDSTGSVSYQCRECKSSDCVHAAKAMTIENSKKPKGK